MERIQKALEKAYQNRQKTESNHTQFTPKPSRLRISVKNETSPEALRKVNIGTEILTNNRIVAALKNDPRAGLFKTLRNKVLQKMRAFDWNIVALSSPMNGMGKSLMSINLAVSIALDANYSAILVDLDMRNPSVHRYFGLSPQYGLSDYFEHDIDLDDLFIHPNLDSLVILPAGKAISQASVSIIFPKMLNLISELNNRYPDRIVVINLPPLLNTDDAQVLIPIVDTCILVVAEQQTTQDEIKRSLQIIGNKKYFGTILNKSAHAS